MPTIAPAIILDGYGVAECPAGTTIDPVWLPPSSGVAWGGITGTLANQTDLATALAGKQAAGSYEPAITAGTAAQYLKGDKTLGTMNAAAVGLGSVENAAASTLYVPLTRTVNGQALSANVTITTITGNAGTATALQTARTINGVAFDGSVNITVTAAAGTLTGTALPAAIVSAPGLVTGSLDAVQNVAPATGATQTFNATKKNELIALTHAATIAAQTIVFPSDANSQIGQVLRVFSRSIVTTVTLTTTGLTLYGTALTTLPASANAAWQKIAASTWARIQ